MTTTNNNNVDLDALKSRYVQIILENNIANTPEENIQDISVIVPELHGQHFASSCDYITIHLKDTEEIELFTKRMVENPQYTKLIKDMQLFPKEAGFFNQIVPALEQLIKERVKPGEEYKLDMVPKCYYACSDLIIMENLAKKGYGLLDKVERQDLDAARMYMRTLAKFNAPSYLLLKAEKSIDDFIEKFPFMAESIGVEENGMGAWIIPLLKAAGKMVEAKACNFPNGAYALEKIQWLQANLMEKMIQPLKPEDGHVAYVVAHGDTWNNNHLFLRDPENGELTHHIMCDFQIVRAASPTIDMAYYMFSSVKHGVRRQEWKNLLHIYYDSLKGNVELLNGQLDFTFEELLADYKKKLVHGFSLGVALVGFVHSASSVGNLDELEGDVMEHVSSSVDRWMEKNPEKLEDCAREIIEMFQEYKQLTTNPFVGAEEEELSF